MPKCKDCKLEFERIKSIQSRCFSCTVKRAKLLVKKKQENEWKERKKVGKEKLTNYKEPLQKEINKIARFIDYGNVCISCQNIPKKNNGCHFHSVGSNEKTRYHLLNIWLGCYSCNGEKGGNVHGYDNGLISLYGKEYWEYLKFELILENNHIFLKEINLKEKLSIAKEIVSELSENLVLRTTEERLKLRIEYNNRLGIYKIK